MSPWKKTFYAAMVAQIFSIMGFMFIIPFLPFYIRELGVTEESAVEKWSGIIGGAAAVTLIIFSPIWGSLGDRYGRRLMVMRAMLGGTVVLVCMGLAQNVTQLLAARLLQGALTGTVSASTALVASVAPTERSGYALGMMQAAVFVGASCGPLLGGVISDQWGYRASCFVAAGMLLVGGLFIRFGARRDIIAAEGADSCPSWDRPAFSSSSSFSSRSVSPIPPRTPSMRCLSNRSTAPARASTRSRA